MKHVVAALGLSLLSLDAAGQIASGALYGKITDHEGRPMPGVTITSRGSGLHQATVSGAAGEYRLIGLPPGPYRVSITLPGFETVSRSIVVELGRTALVNVSLRPAVSDSITVSAPSYDTRRVAAGINVPRKELEEIPNRRDPYALLQNVPGVLLDRVNIAGNETAGQSAIAGHGTTRSQTAWILDGVTITDVGGFGGSPVFFDFDSFEEIDIRTSDIDPRVHSSGVQMNMITKRGTDLFRGSGRWFWTDRSLQSRAVIPAEASSFLAQTDHIDHIEDAGVEAGGPVLNRVWWWGAYGRQRTSSVVAQTISAGSAGSSERSRFEQWNGKLSAQVSRRDHLTLFYNGTTRLFLGRGIGPTRAPETGQNQPGRGAVWKIQQDHLFSPRLHAWLLVARVSNTFSFVPIGGADVDAYRSSDQVYHRSFMASDFDRPQSIHQADASAFLQTTRVGHELRFGVGHRSVPIRFRTRWPGSGNVPWFSVGDSGAGVARLTREANAALETTYSHVYVAETATFGDWTMQGGLRLDVQRGMNRSSRARANPVVPDLLPEAQYEGDPRTLSWQTIVPRLGLTRAWRRTVAHAGYAVYADLLGNTENATANPLAAPQFIDFLWVDGNDDRTIQRSEIQFDRGIIDYLNLDPTAPSSLVSPTRLDYGMRPATMREVLAGVQHELRPRLTLAATATWRVHRNIVGTMFEKTRGAGDYYSSGDYTRFDPNTGHPLTVTGMLPDGSPYSVPYYRLAPGVPLPVFKVVTNRPEYEQSYRGVQLLATRRFSDRWMLQGSLAWSDWRQHIGARGVIDPSMLLDRANGCSSCDDAPVVVGGTMLKDNVYMNARWSGAVNALYEFPWKVTVAANIFARQGYVIPYYHRVSAEETGDRTGAKDVLTAPIDRYRLHMVHNVDLRIARRFGSANGVGCAIAMEVLNATNAQTVLQRQPNLYSSLTRRNPAANQVLETQSPRIARLSVRFFF